MLCPLTMQQIYTRYDRMQGYRERKCEVRGIGEMEESKVGGIKIEMDGWMDSQKGRKKESWMSFEMEEIRSLGMTARKRDDGMNWSMDSWRDGEM